MRTIIAGLALGLFSTQAVAQTQTAAFFALRAQGERGWTAQCTLQHINGRTLERDMRGTREDRQVIASRSITGGRCEYRASSAGALELDFDDSRFECPFTSPAGTCRTRVAAGQTGSFEVRIRR